MKIVPDTSFLVSWLISQDVNHGKAAGWFASRAAEDWIISPWAEFETVNSLRSLVRQTPGPSAVSIEARRRYFKHLFQQGPLIRQTVDWLVAIKDAHEISFALAMRLPVRAADTLHVAILEQVNPDVFVTFDKDQSAVATNRGFQTVHLR